MNANKVCFMLLDILFTDAVKTDAWDAQGRPCLQVLVATEPYIQFKYYPDKKRVTYYGPETITKMEAYFPIGEEKHIRAFKKWVRARYGLRVRKVSSGGFLGRKSVLDSGYIFAPYIPMEFF